MRKRPLDVARCPVSAGIKCPQQYLLILAVTAIIQSSNCKNLWESSAVNGIMNGNSGKDGLHELVVRKFPSRDTLKGDDAKASRSRRAIIDNSGKLRSAPLQFYNMAPAIMQRRHRESPADYSGHQHHQEASFSRHIHQQNTPSASRIMCSTGNERGCRDLSDKFDYGPVPVAPLMLRQPQDQAVVPPMDTVVEGQQQAQFVPPYFAVARPYIVHTDHHDFPATEPERLGVLLNPISDQPVIGAPPIETINLQHPFGHFREDITFLPRDIESPRIYINPMFVTPGQITNPSKSDQGQQLIQESSHHQQVNHGMYAVFDGQPPAGWYSTEATVTPSTTPTTTSLPPTPMSSTVKFAACFHLPLTDSPEVAKNLLEELSQRILEQASPAHQDNRNIIKQKNDHLFEVRINAKQHDSQHHSKASTTTTTPPTTIGHGTQQELKTQTNHHAARNIPGVRGQGPSATRADDFEYAQPDGPETPILATMQNRQNNALVIRIENAGTDKIKVRRPQLLVDDGELEIPAQPVTKRNKHEQDLSLAPIVSYRLKLDRKTAGDVAAALENYILMEKIAYITKHRAMKLAQQRFDQDKTAENRVSLEVAKAETDDSLGVLKMKITQFFTIQAACLEHTTNQHPLLELLSTTHTPLTQTIPETVPVMGPMTKMEQVLSSSRPKQSLPVVMETEKPGFQEYKSTLLAEKLLPDDEAELKPATLTKRLQDSTEEAEYFNLSQDGLNLKAAHAALDAEIDAELNLATQVRSSLFDSLLRDADINPNSSQYMSDAGDRMDLDLFYTTPTGTSNTSNNKNPKAIGSLPKLNKEHAHHLQRISATFQDPVRLRAQAVRDAAKQLQAEPTSKMAKAKFADAAAQLKAVKTRLNKAIMSYFRISFGDSLDEHAMAAMLIDFKKQFPKPTEAHKRQVPTTFKPQHLQPAADTHRVVPSGLKTGPTSNRKRRQEATLKFLQNSINKSIMNIFKKRKQPRKVASRSRRSVSSPSRDRKQEFLLSIIHEKTKVEALTKEAAEQFHNLKVTQNDSARRIFLNVKHNLRNSKIELLKKMEQLLAQKFRNEFTLSELETMWETITLKKPSKTKVVSRLSTFARDTNPISLQNIGPAYWTPLQVNENNRSVHDSSTAAAKTTTSATTTMKTSTSSPRPTSSKSTSSSRSTSSSTSTSSSSKSTSSSTWRPGLGGDRMSVKLDLQLLKQTLELRKKRVEELRTQSRVKMLDYLRAETPTKRKEFLAARDALLRAKLLLHERVRAELRKLFGDPKTMSKNDYAAIWRYLLGSGGEDA